ncbi:hypothetical protein ACF05W_35230 [Streptomyces lydicus]|uniref:hypothetical protein n=1 Tax=Streptomyces lydicus TaxID=47763 RepID=UPI0036FE9EEC
MPRGRHRHSPPLHRLLPPSTVAGVSIACAAGAWFVGDDLVQRVLAAGAAAAALTGAVLLRSWDRKAGRRVAELTRARVRDEWRTEERIAELETDVEEGRELRTALEGKLRAKRAELARLRSEHAELLRRYATAETERASALEGRRLLAIEAAPAKALSAVAGSPRSLDSLRTAKAPTRRGPAADRDRPAPGTATYAQADQALRQLARNAARQRAARDAAPASGGATGTPQGRDGDSRGNAPAAAPERTGGADRARTAPGSALRPVPATAAALTPARPTASRELGGFDFFGNSSDAPSRQLTAPLEEDLADVVGEEALAEQSARTEGRHRARTQGRPQLPAGNDERADDAPPGTDEDSAARSTADADGALVADGPTTSGAGEVIDLTAHDETEQLDVGVLRSAIS